jgi:hypothetical protein
MPRFIACLLFAASLPAMAQIYEYTDANGNKAFTNQPPDGSLNAQPVEVSPINVVDVPDTLKAPQPPAPTQQAGNQPRENANTDDQGEHYSTDDGDDYYGQPRPTGVDAIGADLGRGRVGTPRVDPIGIDPGRGRAGSPGRR